MFKDSLHYLYLVKHLLNRIFSIDSEAAFEECALDVFQYQLKHQPVYRNFVELLGKPLPTSSNEIPCLPIDFFKTQSIISDEKTAQTVFKSSGTTSSTRSQHLVAELDVYEQSFFYTYRQFIGNPEDQIIFALLPSYVSQGESSLVYMVDKLIEKTNNVLSGFYLESHNQLLVAIETARATGKKLVLFGVSYALLDLAEIQPDLNDVLVIETGGMKGRRKEMPKATMHAILKEAFKCEYISSEYGMTELLSQAYSNRDGLFKLPSFMKVYIRDVNDPLSFVSDEKNGGVNVIDLCNLYSCSFIATQDLGRITNGQLELIGRYDNSDIRGCNLLVQS